MIRRKAGTLRDVVFFAGFGLFSIFLSFLLIQFLFSSAFAIFVDAAGVRDSDTALSVLTRGDEIFKNFDVLVITIFIAILLSFIITSWFTAGHPAITVMYFFGGVGAVILSMIVSNFWEEITLSTMLSDSLQYFPIANHIMLYLPVYIGIIWFIGLVITLTKPVQQQTMIGG